MAQAKRPSSDFKNKTNVIPSIDRKTEATAEDFREAGEILDDHAAILDQLTGAGTPNPFYQFWGSLDLLIASHPVVEEEAYAVIEPAGRSPQIAKFRGGQWQIAESKAPVITVPTYLDLPEIGEEGVLYIVKDSAYPYLWINGGWQDVMGKKLQEALNEVQDVSEKVKNLQTHITQTFADGIIDTAEARSIALYINSLNTQKAELDSRYTSIESSTYLPQAEKTALGNIKAAYNTAHSNLIEAINTAITDMKATPEERDNVDSKFTAYGTAISNLTTALQSAIEKIEDERVKKQIGNIEIGGRNLIQNSSLATNTNGWNPYASQNIEQNEGWIRVRQGVDSKFGIVSPPTFSLKEGKIYTLSFLAGSHFNVDSLNYIHLIYTDGEGNHKLPTVVINPGTVNLNPYSLTFTAPRSGDNVGILIARTDSDLNLSNGFKLSQVKLEKGNKATDWTPSPEDVEALIHEQTTYREYSPDGVNWGLSLDAGDIYMRERKGSGAWSDPIRIVGEEGAAGKDGKFKSFQFSKNTSTSTPPTSGWQDAPPTISEGEFVWMRSGEVVPPETAPAQWGTPTRITGPQGPPGKDGTDGDRGPKGNDGLTSYFHRKYSSIENPTETDQMSETPDVYIGTYVDFEEADSTNPADYTWSRFQGLKGDKGEPGIGEDGKTYYWHVAYADSEDGSVNFTTGAPGTRSFMGTLVDLNENDPGDHTLYEWKKIRGEPITSATEPANKYPGMVWIDSSKTPAEQKIWTGSKWERVGFGIDDIEIGGRNLAGNTDFHKTPEAAYGSSLTVIAGKPNILRVEKGSRLAFILDRITDVGSGGKYTLSFEYRGDVTGLWYNHLMDDDEGNSNDLPNINLENDGEWHRSSITYTSSTTRSNAGIMLATGTAEPGTWLEIKKIKFEKGNIATDWEPAPEDVENSIEVVAQAKAELAETQAKSYADGKISDEEARAIADAEAKYEAALSHAQELVDNVQIGGRNMVQNSSLQNGIEGWSLWNSPTIDDHGDSIRIRQSASSAFGLVTPQTFSVKSGENYTLSFLAASHYGVASINYCHIIYSDGQGNHRLNNITIDGSSTAVKKYSLTFTAPRDDNNVGILIARYDNNISSSNGFRLAEVKLEKGNKATAWSPYIPDDLEQQIAELENVKSTTETLSKKTNHLETDVDGNVITTGTVVIGNATEQNGGMTGINDKGSKSARIWQGASFAGRYNAPWRILADGTQQTKNSFNEWYYPNGQLGMEMGIRDGKPAFNIYSEDGQLIVFLGAGGITFGDYIPESWPEAKFYRLSTAASPSDATLLDAYKALLRKSVITSSNEDSPNSPHNTVDGWTIYAVDKQGTIITGYRYNAGVGLDSADRVQYEGYIYASKSYASGNYFADGWYANTASPQTGIIYHGEVDSDGDGFTEHHSGHFTSEAIIFRIQGGVTVETRRIPFTENALTLPNL